ncbi:MAG: RNA polymerase sigma factor FliA [Deltaproteobacteria bacterium]|nr:RNA polymerase sigma factor FliA [Deltaproteobacteria bacterium]
MPALTSQSRNTLAKKLIPLVHEVAGQVARRVPSHVALEDLVGAGMLGLVGAINRYDPERSDTFKGYAEFRIRGEIMDELRRRDIMSRDARIESKKLQRTIQELSNTLGREAQDDEVAEHIGVSLVDYRALQLRLNGARMVSAEEMELPASEVSPADNVQGQQLRELLSCCLDSLPKRQRLVLWLFYFEELPLREIGEILGVSPSRVCQIRAQAVSALRGRIQAAA